MLDITRLPVPANKSNYTLWAGSEEEMHRIVAAQDFMVVIKDKDGVWRKLATPGFNEMEFLKIQVQHMKAAAVPPLPALSIKDLPKVLQPSPAPAAPERLTQKFEVPE